MSGTESNSKAWQSLRFKKSPTTKPDTYEIDNFKNWMWLIKDIILMVERFSLFTASKSPRVTVPARQTMWVTLKRLADGGFAD